MSFILEEEVIPPRNWSSGWSLKKGGQGGKRDQKMSYKPFKEFFQSCPVKRCSSVPTKVELHSSLDRVNSSASLVATDGEERKPPKTSLKDRIAALVGSGSVPDRNQAVPSHSRTIPSPTDLSEVKERVHFEEEDRYFKKRSFIDSSNEVDLYKRAEEDSGRVDESRTETSGGASSSKSYHLPRKRTENGPTRLPADSSKRKNSSPGVMIPIEEDDEDEEAILNFRLGDDEEPRVDSEAVRFTQPIPKGPFEPLLLWPPAGQDSTLDDNGKEETVVEVPASINSRLLEYQREGVHFLYDLYRNNRGGILGDDMGLGKTIQTIAFLAAILQKDSFRKESLLSSLATKVGVPKQRCEKAVLIICPTSVVHNWEQEFQAWGEFQVGVSHRSQRESVLVRVVAQEVEIVITSHETFRIYGGEFCEMHWDCVVVDEAHRLKNDKSQFYIMCLKLPTTRRYGLTGTVMQNNYMELFNVFDWASPGCLGTRDHFREYYASPITEGQRISAPQRFVTIAEDRNKHMFMKLRICRLRRTKQEVGLLMKGKEDNVVFCPMSSVQKRVYRRVLESPDYQALKTKGLPCSCGSPLTRGECCYRIVPDGVIWPSLHKDNLDTGCDFCPDCLMLPCLTKLKLLSNHLELIKPNPKDDPEKQDKDYKFARMAFGEDADAVGGIEQEQSFLGLSDSQHCGKMAALDKLLASWITQGDKVLLFSDSVRLLDIVEKFLIRKGYSFSRLDGATAMNSRQALVEDFNFSPSKQIFLISTRAGGLGLNLTSANRVVIFDPNWNPSHDLQAQDRSFRFGQNRHVTVFRLLAAGTLEELIYTRQVYKQQLFNIAMAGAAEKRYFEGVQGSKQHKGELFGMSNLFRDISEDHFAEDIIENHEERFLRIQQLAALEDETSPLEHTKAEDLEEELDHPGDVTCDETDHCGSPQPAAKEQDQGDIEEERRVKGIVQKALTKAGVVYSHRNEDVVNLGPSVLKVPKRVKRATSLPNRSTKLEDKVIVKHFRSKQNRNIGRCSQKMRPATETGSMQGKDPGPGQAKKQISEGQRSCFAKLAEFKGMNKSEFSNWYVCATREEQTQLRLEYLESQARVSS